MRNFLIPTILQFDTVHAIKTAIRSSKGESCQLILMLISEVPDTFSSSYLLRNINQTLTPSQEDILQLSRAVIDEAENCSLKILHQYGISSPLFKNLIDHYAIELTIITPSFKFSKKKINNYCFQIISNSKCHILHTSSNFEEEDLNQALYLKDSKSLLQVEDLQAFVRNIFDLKIVSQTKIDENPKTNEIESILTEALSKNNINILIETRKPKKIKSQKKEKVSLNEVSGLPVLSISEDAY